MTGTMQAVMESEPQSSFESWSDEALLTAYRVRGDRGAFEALVHRYERELYSYLRRYLQDAALAEDAFQGTFLQVHLNCREFDVTRKVKPWLYTIATNQAIDLQRRNKRHRVMSLDQRHWLGDGEEVGALLDLLASDDSTPDDQLELAERQRWVENAVNRLPEVLRSAVHLIYYQGLKYREAADALAVPVGTVKSRMHAALLKLNEAWRRREESSSS